MLVISPAKCALITRLARYLTFTMALLVLASFVLPWLRIEGVPEGHSGLDLMKLPLTEAGIFQFLYSVNPGQAVILALSPVIMFLLALPMALKYARRRTTVLPSTLILALAIILLVGESAFLVSSAVMDRIGLLAIVVLSGILLLHSALIKIGMKLLRRNMYPMLHQYILLFTGTGKFPQSSDGFVGAENPGGGSKHPTA